MSKDKHYVARLALKFDGSPRHITLKELVESNAFPNVTIERDIFYYYLTPQEYERQLSKPDSRWKWPEMDLLMYYDDHYEPKEHN